MQVIVFAVKTYVPEEDDIHILLNPGHMYTFREEDGIFVIAQDMSEIEDIMDLDDENFGKIFSQSALPASPTIENCMPSASRYPNGDSKGIVLGKHPRQVDDIKLPICYLLAEPCQLESVTLSEVPRTFPPHILLLTLTHDILVLISTLRSEHLGTDQIKPIVILTARLPTASEWTALHHFPDIYYVVVCLSIDHRIYH